MPPPGTEADLLAWSVGLVTSGPPPPPRPAETLTALDSAMCVSPLQTVEVNALAAGQDVGDPFGHVAFRHDHDQAHDEIPDGQGDNEATIELAGIAQGLQRHENAAPDEVFARIDVREQA